MNMKRIITLLSFLMLLGGILGAQTLDESKLNKPSKDPNFTAVRKSLVQNYQIDYARSGQFGVNGKGAGKGGFHFGPRVEMGIDPKRWGSIAVGFNMDYRQVYTQMFYRFTLPFYGFNTDNIGHSAIFRLGVNTFGFQIQNEFEGGKIRTNKNLLTSDSVGRSTAQIGVQDFISLNGLLFDDNANRVELDMKGGFRHYFELDESFWEVGANLKYRNRHPWGEFGLAFFGWHADKVGDKDYKDLKLESGLNLWEDVLGAAFILNQDIPSDAYFNTVVALNAEYRFYFLYPLHRGWRNLYLGVIGGTGFGFKHGNYQWSDSWLDNYKNHGIWWYGGTLGYNFHDAIAFQSGVLVNNNKSFLVLIGLDILSFSL